LHELVATRSKRSHRPKSYADTEYIFSFHFTVLLEC
jgi:hypothetical protein